MYNDNCSETYILIYDCEVIESNVPFLTFHLVILKNVSKNVSKKKKMTYSHSSPKCPLPQIGMFILVNKTISHSFVQERNHEPKFLFTSHSFFSLLYLQSILLFFISKTMKAKNLKWGYSTKTIKKWDTFL